MCAVLVIHRLCSYVVGSQCTMIQDAKEVKKSNGGRKNKKTVTICTEEDPTPCFRNRYNRIY